MTLFLPTARATNLLLIVAFSALGFALYMRYLGVEQPGVGLACEAGLNTWLCTSRRVVIEIFTHSGFGIAALVAAAINLLRPTLTVFAVAIAASCLGVVLYNVETSGLAAGLLVLSLARREPEPE